MHNNDPGIQTAQEVYRSSPEARVAYATGIEALELQREYGVVEVVPAYIVRQAGFGENALVEVGSREEGLAVCLWRFQEPLDDDTYDAVAAELVAGGYLNSQTADLRVISLIETQDKKAVEALAYDTDAIGADEARAALQSATDLNVQDQVKEEYTAKVAGSVSTSYELGLLNVTDVECFQLATLFDMYRNAIREAMGVPGAEALHGLRASQQQLQSLRSASWYLGPACFVDSYIPPGLVDRIDESGARKLIAMEEWQEDLAHVIWRLDREALIKAGMDGYLREAGITSDIIVSATPTIQNVQNKLNEGVNVLICYDTAEGTEGDTIGNMVLLQHTGFDKVVVGRHFTALDIKFSDTPGTRVFSNQVMAMLASPHRHVTEATVRGLHELIDGMSKPGPQMPGVISRLLLRIRSDK
jgi:hypothetical protein